MNAPELGKRFLLPSLLAVALLATLTGAAADPHASRSAVAAGQKAPAFRATTVAGKTILFPGDYKGKVVLLDFWATYCHPCREQLPSVVAAYNEYHDKGFEVLGVSLDVARKGPELLQFIKDHNMPWPQIYDGQAAKTPVAVAYGVHAIPCPVLVDGDTGVILATDLGAMGHKLTKTLQSALAAKAEKK